MNSEEYERICRVVCNILIVATLIVVKYLVTCSIVSKVNHMILSILGSDVLVLYVVCIATAEVVYVVTKTIPDTQTGMVAAGCTHRRCQVTLPPGPRTLQTWQSRLDGAVSGKCDPLRRFSVWSW